MKTTPEQRSEWLREAKEEGWISDGPFIVVSEDLDAALAENAELIVEMHNLKGGIRIVQESGSIKIEQLEARVAELQTSASDYRNQHRDVAQKWLNVEAECNDSWWKYWGRVGDCE